MEMKHTAKFLRQRKFLAALPLLVLPFTTLTFWALGGGSVTATEAKASKGFNRDLPGVHFKSDQEPDKLSYYAQADQDSAKIRELKKNDPYYQFDDTVTEPVSSDEQKLGFGGSGLNYKNSGYSNLDRNEEKLQLKLQQLNESLEEAKTPVRDEYQTGTTRNTNTAEVQRLEQMMQAMQPSGKDAEIEQLDGMLQKIMEIQNPAIAQEKLRQASEQKRGKVFIVTKGKEPDPVSSLEKPSGSETYINSTLNRAQNGFFSFDNAATLPDSQNSIAAIIHENQEIVSGATVKMRLADEIYINGIKIPKDNFIYGTASLNGERLAIKISSVRFKNSLFPVELSVYDMDGLEGLYIPGAISRDVAKESANRGMQNIGFSSLDPTIGMQAASVGVEAVKNLFSKKVKLVRVSVKAGYQVLLKDEKQKQQN